MANTAYTNTAKQDQRLFKDLEYQTDVDDNIRHLQGCVVAIDLLIDALLAQPRIDSKEVDAMIVIFEGIKRRVELLATARDRHDGLVS